MELAGDVVAGLGHVDALATAARIRGIIAAEELGLAEQAGAASPAEWLADVLRMSRAEASRESRDAALLFDRADTMAALASGPISWTHARQLAEQRSREQRDADAFIDILNTAARAGSLPTTHGTRPQVTVTAPLETLLGGDQPGRAGNGTLLSPDPRAVPDELARTGTVSASNRMWGASRPTWKAETVRRLACDANLSRAIVNATGVVLDLGTATSRWSAPQYRAIAASFTGCAFPVSDGTPCDRPISWCEIPHVTFVEHGGPHDQGSHTTTVARRRRAVTTTRTVTHTAHSTPTPPPQGRRPIANPTRHPPKDGTSGCSETPGRDPLADRSPRAVDRVTAIGVKMAAF